MKSRTKNTILLSIIVVALVLFYYYDNGTKYLDKAMIKLNVTSVMSEDKKLVDTFINDTITVLDICYRCHQIDNLVNNLSRHVPIMEAVEDKNFWNNKLIPIMVDLRVEIQMALSTTYSGFSAISELQISIRKIGEIVKLTQGTSDGIEIAKTGIPKALNKLRQMHLVVSQLDNGAFRRLKSNYNKTITIVGDKTANFVQRMVLALEVIDNYYAKEKNQSLTIAEQQAELKRLDLMIELYLNYIEETVGEVNRKKWRVSNLTQLNDQLEKKIQDIPTSIERTETEYHSFWFLEWQSSYTKSVSNPDKNSDKVYYESLIKSRHERVQSGLNETARMIEHKRGLEDELVRLHAQRKKLAGELIANKDFMMNKATTDRDILKNALKEINQINAQSAEAKTQLGLEGKLLIDTLSLIKRLSGSEKLIGFGPMADLLAKIITAVEHDTNLIEKGRPSIVIFAVDRLMNQVKLLNKLATDARYVLTHLTKDVSGIDLTGRWTITPNK